jgi:hypothetical protein
MEISRWCQPPDNAKKNMPAPAGAKERRRNYPPPLPGLFSCGCRFRWLTPPANFPQPSGFISLETGSAGFQPVSDRLPSRSAGVDARLRESFRRSDAHFSARQDAGQGGLEARAPHCPFATRGLLIFRKIFTLSSGWEAFAWLGADVALLLADIIFLQSAIVFIRHAITFPLTAILFLQFYILFLQDEIAFRRDAIIFLRFAILFL